MGEPTQTTPSWNTLTAPERVAALMALAEALYSRSVASNLEAWASLSNVAQELAGRVSPINWEALPIEALLIQIRELRTWVDSDEARGLPVSDLSETCDSLGAQLEELARDSAPIARLFHHHPLTVGRRPGSLDTNLQVKE